tara:strand:- start:472 stop:1344 length:873 start_codon:yes stop_codon:yes gene_type:complete
VATKRLGRGINALIRETTDESAQTNPIFHVPLKLVSPNPHQPRQKFDEKSLKELAESIREKGIIQPITVRTRDKGYELIAGERRLRAAKLAGLTEVPAHVLEIEDDVEMMEMALIENIQRENLNVVEEAEAYAMLNNNYKLSHTAIAKAVGKSRASISNMLRLLKLPAEVIESLRKNEISAGHARALLGLKKTSQMLLLWKRIVERQESVRAVEELVKQMSNGETPVKKRQKKLKLTKSADIRKLENDLISIFGTKVSITAKRKGGIIEISYFSGYDLERLLELFSEIED